MSDSDPNQLRLDVEIDQGKSGIIKSPLEKIDYYRKSNGDLVSDEQIDHYANVRGCSMHEAFLHFGVKPDDRISETDKSCEKPSTKSRSLIVATDLGERAVNLDMSARMYSESAKDDARMRELLNSGADDAEIDQATVDEMTHRYEGDAVFHKLWPTKDLKTVEFNPIEIRSEEKDMREDFYDLSTNPERQDELKKLVGSTDNPKEKSHSSLDK